MFSFKVLRVKNCNIYSSKMLRNYVTISRTIINNNNLLFKNILHDIETNLKFNTSCVSAVNIKNDVFKKTSANDALSTVGNIPFNINNKLANSKLETDKTVLHDVSEESAAELAQIAKLYEQPKVTLNNYYAAVASELKSTSYRLQAQFKAIVLKTKKKGQTPWVCTYQLKWPEERQISATANTKHEASNKASLKALLWLKKKEKIDSNGSPIIYDRDQFQAITSTHTIVPLVIDENIESKLHAISDEFDTNLSTKLVNKYDEFRRRTNRASLERNVTNDWSEYGDSKNVKPRRSKYRNLSTLRAIEKVRLPIADHRKELEELLANNRVVVIKGEPGCGKSTRVPQYILEQWVEKHGNDACKIVVTQPRRIAAISLADRVANERNENVGDVVGYQVRFSSNFNQNTGRILYCTTGILLRRIQSDPGLQDCTHIILDEAHERDVNTDLLMNLLRHALKINPTLQLVVMSATIDTKLFQNYFPNEADGNESPVIKIPGFAHPVRRHFLDDIDLNLPATKVMCGNNTPSVVCDEVADVIKWIHKTKREGAILCFLPGWEEISRLRRLLTGCRNSRDWSVLALHSRLPDFDQKKIFSRPPPGIRKIILATNIAETSVTIDDVVYVVDTGIHKEERYNSSRGVMSIDHHWISQSSMNQRKGRAGRVQPGESFHLYPEYRYEQMSMYSIPEILRTSLTKIVLDSKVYSNNMNAIEFLGHLPNPPKNVVIAHAVQELKDLDLLDGEENLTSLGRTLSNFQLPPKLGKAMVNAVIFKCSAPVVDIATLFSSESELFISALVDKAAVKKLKKGFCDSSDHVAMMRIFENWFEFMLNEELYDAEEYCRRNNIAFFKMKTLERLRDVHFQYLYNGLKNVLPICDDFSDNTELVKAVVLSGVGSVLLPRNWDIVKGRLKKTQVLLTAKGQKATITPESVNHQSDNLKNKFLLYINETRSELRRSSLIRETSVLSPLTFLLFKNNKLYLEETNDKKYKSELTDPVLLKLKNTKLIFLCDRRQAESIIKCKKSLDAAVQYFIFQLTDGGEQDLDINQSWSKILLLLSDLLSAFEHSQTSKAIEE